MTKQQPVAPPLPTADQIAASFVEMAAELDRRKDVAKKWERLKPLVKKLHDIMFGDDAPAEAPLALTTDIPIARVNDDADLPRPTPGQASGQPLPNPQSNALLCDLSMDPVSGEILRAWAEGNRGMRVKLAERMDEISGFDDQVKVIRGEGYDKSEPTYNAAFGELRAIGSYDFNKPAEKKLVKGKLVALFGPF